MLERARAEAEGIVRQAESDASALVERRGRMAEDKIAAAERAALDEVRAKAARGRRRRRRDPDPREARRRRRQGAGRPHDRRAGHALTATPENRHPGLDPGSMNAGIGRLEPPVGMDSGFRRKDVSSMDPAASLD